MRGYRYLHVCRHRFSSGTVEATIDSPELFSEANKMTATLIEGANVLEILEVRVERYAYDDTNRSAYDVVGRATKFDEGGPNSRFDDDRGFRVDFGPYFKPGETLSEPIPKTMYRSFLHNRIEFLVYPPISFRVKMRVRYTDARETIYDATRCPRCEGRGWYIDLLDEKGEFGEAIGGEHVIQDFVKIMLMRVGSSMLDRWNGSRLHEVAGSSETADEVELQVSAIISECAANYLEQQAVTDTSLYAPDEVLLDVSLARIERDTNDRRRWRIYLNFTTEAGERGFLLSL